MILLKQLYLLILSYNIGNDNDESLNPVDKNHDEFKRLSEAMRMMFDEVLKDSKIW